MGGRVYSPVFSFFLDSKVDTVAKFPRKIEVSSRLGAQTYTLLPGYYAMHGKSAGNLATEAAYELNEGTITVFRGEPDQSKLETAGDKLTPVYALGQGGSPAVPTGLVFLRLADGATIDESTQEINEAGFEVAETLAYAPNAAWLRARSGDIADALNGLKALEKIPSVESVEPQMLMEAARR